jgi:CRP/FNR family transcriptional regulator, cyclic AMP receptor protein
MAQHLRQLKAGEILFKDGDPSDAMYVVKKGRLSVFKSKGNAEVELAEVGPGSMIGEMAFFDQKPRSASVKAALDSEVIELPFKALKAQYETFPEWLKAIIKTINEHLREANKRIKNLEQGETAKGASGGARGIAPHQANKLCAILMFVAHKWGTQVPEGIDVKPGLLRKFTIQVFQEPTNKMQTLMGILCGMGIMKQEDLGEGKQKITLLKPDLLYGFVDWFNEYLFAAEDKKVTVGKDDLKIMHALIHFAKKGQPDDKGQTKVNLNTVQNESMKELGYLVGLNDVNNLSKSGLISDKISEKDGMSVTLDRAELEKLHPYWQLYYAIESGGA